MCYSLKLIPSEVDICYNIQQRERSFLNIECDRGSQVCAVVGACNAGKV